MNNESDLPNSSNSQPDETAVDPAVEQSIQDAFDRLNTDAHQVDAMAVLRRYEDGSARVPWFQRPQVLLASVVELLQRLPYFH